MFSYLETLSSTYVFRPHDWKMLLKMVLTTTQYSVWLTDFRESCAAHANDQSGLQSGMTCVHLVGEEAYLAPGSQVDYPQEIYAIIVKLVLRAVWRLPSTDRDSNLSSTDRDSNLPFAKVLQGPTEPFLQFLDWLQDSLSRQIEIEDARELLFRQFAYENANNDSRQALQSIPKRKSCTVAEMVQACQNGGSIHHHTTFLATALAAQLRWDQMESDSLRILEWLFLHHSPPVWTIDDMFAKLVVKGIGRLQELDGRDPETIYIPATKDNLDWFLAEDTGFQDELADYNELPGPIAEGNQREDAAAMIATVPKTLE
ncbi:hypothetical protein BTVI_00867 [Pitangus sulphuratus]|nr:hypothetical protein BTVI_00867 [Pitangus sulphuratus]